MSSAVDKNYRFILSWIIGVNVDCTVNVRKLYICVGLDAHALAGEDFYQDDHIVGVNMLQGVLVDEIWVCNKHHSGLAYRYSKVLNCCWRRNDLIQ